MRNTASMIRMPMAVRSMKPICLKCLQEQVLVLMQTVSCYCFVPAVDSRKIKEPLYMVF